MPWKHLAVGQNSSISYQRPREVEIINLASVANGRESSGLSCPPFFSLFLQSGKIGEIILCFLICNYNLEKYLHKNVKESFLQYYFTEKPLKGTGIVLWANRPVLIFHIATGEGLTSALGSGASSVSLCACTLWVLLFPYDSMYHLLLLLLNAHLMAL